MVDQPFAPTGAPPAPFSSGPSYAQLLAVLQSLVQATNALAGVTQASTGKPSSGDISGILPGPITVVATHLNAPLPVAQGGTGLAGGNTGGLLYFSAPGVVASSNTLGLGALLIGGGPGAAPASLGFGTATTVLHGNPGGPPVYGPVAAGDIANGAVSYSKIQNEAASTLLGNPTTSSLPPEEISLGATLAFVGATLQTGALSGDVTAGANSFATMVGRIAGNAVAPAAWTPALEFGGAATGITYSVQSGTVIQLGKMVAAFFGFTLTSKGSATGSATITGLPFTCGALAGVGIIGAHSNLAGGVVFEIDVPAAGTAIALGKGNAASSSALVDTDFTNTSALAGVALYISA